MKILSCKTWLMIYIFVLLTFGGCFGTERGSHGVQDKKTLNLWSQFYSLIGQSEFTQAVNLATQIINRTPKDPLAYQQRAIALMQTGQQNEAIADYSKSLSLGSNDPHTYSLRGTSYFLSGQYERALSDMNMAIDIDPAQWPFYYGRAEVYFVQGLLDRAQSDLTQAINLNPECGEALFHLAYILHKKSDKDKARAYFEKAFQLQPEILTRREQAQQIALSQEVRDFFEEEATVANEYIYGETEEVEDLEQPQVAEGQDVVKIEIYDVSTKPTEVIPSEEFELRVDYMITDNTISDNNLPFTLTYSILEGEEVRAELLNHYKANRGTRETQIIGLRASRKIGTYTIKVILQYKEKIAGQSIRLQVK